jgi:hypothetical protein
VHTKSVRLWQFAHRQRSSDQRHIAAAGVDEALQTSTAT